MFANLSLHFQLIFVRFRLCYHSFTQTELNLSSCELTMYKINVNFEGCTNSITNGYLFKPVFSKKVLSALVYCLS